MPWYKQTAVWGVIFSFLAIILSQVPPILRWMPKNEINVVLGKRIGLPNIMGLTGYQIFIEVKNDGNRVAEISNLRILLHYPNGENKTFIAQSYRKIIPGQMLPLDFPVTTISLAPASSWVESVDFYPDISPQDEESLYVLRQKLVASLNQNQRESQMAPMIPYVPIEADPQVVQQIKDFFDKKFDIEKGEYQAKIIANANGGDKVLQEFGFTLYDYHKTIIISQKEDYKYGWGIAPMTQVSPEKQIWAQISTKKNMEQGLTN